MQYLKETWFRAGVILIGFLIVIYLISTIGNYEFIIPYIFLLLLLCSAIAIFAFLIYKGRNAWDALFFNSTLAIIALFMIGILVNNFEIWRTIVIALGFIATGEKIVGFFVDKK